MFLAPARAAAEERVSREDASARAALGQRLFSDTSLSADARVSCETCHQPGAAFTDGLPVSRGVLGRVGTRNAPSLLGLARTRELFWDGRRDSLEALVFDPLTAPEEHGLEDVQAVLSAVRARHASDFERVFPGRGVTQQTVAQALADFVRQLPVASSAFDRAQAGDRAALVPAQRRGWALFTGRAGCARCHHLEGGALTDGAYHAGEVRSELIPHQAEAAREAVGMSREARRASVPARAEMAALGRFAVTLSPTDLGRFRTPSLRNVAVTAPYMHDGSIPTLLQAVERELYYRSTPGRQVGDLTPSERSDLVEFLKALTSAVSPSHPPDATPRVH
ncbi:cytochrome c peroxidase [Myxococcus sp. CA040A]|uniref:cytochrome-c peroxidase n=1 Tax=Myxococcus sp. CA040A TaxID=2741738 RepID=UPI00157B184D|nr:c-type cytochrome [Myxococcus sp. CA040A]